MKPQPETANQEVLAGLVERVTYHNGENGFCVLRAKADVATVVDATLLGHASILFDLAIRPASAVGWRNRGGRRLRRNRSGRIFGRDRRFLLLLSLGRRPNGLKICMHWVGDKPRKFGTHRDSLRLIALVCERRREFCHIERELTRRATALP